MKAITAPSHYIDTSSSRLSTETIAGRQCWGFVSIAGQQDLAVIGARFNTMANPGFPKPPIRYLLNKSETNINFANLGQANSRLCVYHCRAKRDIYNSMNYTSSSGATVYPWATIVDAVQQGLEAATGGAVSGGVTYFIPGADHTESPIFNKYFKVMKTTEVLLSVGGCHKYTANIDYDKVMDATVYGDTVLNSVLGVTDFLLFKAQGQTGAVISTDEPLDPANNTVQIAPTQIGLTINWDYTAYQVQNAAAFNLVSDPLGATGDPVTVISGSTGSGALAVGLV